MSVRTHVCTHHIKHACGAHTDDSSHMPTNSLSLSLSLLHTCANMCTRAHTFTRNFLVPAPAWIAHDVDVRCVVAQAKWRALQTLRPACTRRRSAPPLDPLCLELPLSLFSTFSLRSNLSLLSPPFIFSTVSTVSSVSSVSSVSAVSSVSSIFSLSLSSLLSLLSTPSLLCLLPRLSAVSTG